MNPFLDLLLPRFITEECALENTPKGPQPVCRMEDVLPGEIFDSVGLVRHFNLFGLMILPQLIDDPTPWPGGTTPHPTPGILKGIARYSGDGFKDPTRQGDVVYVWDTELPSLFAEGQYPRVGNHIYSARNDQFDFTPVPPAQVRQVVDSLIAHERSEKQDANAKVAWLTKQLAALEPVAAPTPFSQEIPQTSASHITTDEHGMGSAMAHTMIKRSENTQ